MTFSAVVACENSFYLFSDMRTLDVTTGKVYENTQKVFYSVKHRIGLCIAGSAFLRCSKDPENLKKSLNVSLVLSNFFSMLDGSIAAFENANIITCEDLVIKIFDYIETKFNKSYRETFQSEVSLFLACIVNGKTQIASFHALENESNKIIKVCNWHDDHKSKICMYANYNDPVSHSLNELVKKNIVMKNFESINNFLGSREQRVKVLTSIFLSSINRVLTIFPESIGTQYHYIMIDTNGNRKKVMLSVKNNILEEVKQSPPLHEHLYFFPVTEHVAQTLMSQPDTYPKFPA